MQIIDLDRWVHPNPLIITLKTLISWIKIMLLSTTTTIPITMQIPSSIKGLTNLNSSSKICMELRWTNRCRINSKSTIFSINNNSSSSNNNNQIKKEINFINKSNLNLISAMPRNLMQVKWLKIIKLLNSQMLLPSREMTWISSIRSVLRSMQQTTKLIIQISSTIIMLCKTLFLKSI